MTRSFSQLPEALCWKLVTTNSKTSCHAKKEKEEKKRKRDL
jgi:hypothetical protein